MKLESSATFYKSKEDENTHVLDTKAKLNGVLDETTTANTRGRSSRAHARLCKFTSGLTSGSRPSSSRRPILRSLMEKRDLVGREEIINNEPNDREMKPLLVPTQPVYVKFRQGRETLAPVKSNELALNVFKVCFSSVGLWNHQAWNFIPRILLATVCLYQVCYSLYFDVLDKCRLNYRNETEKEKMAMEHSTYTEHIAEALLNLASVSSFLVFTCCFMVAKRKRSACVLPSLSAIENNDRKITLTLFAFFIFTTLLLASAIGLLYNTSIEIKLVEGSFCRHILVAAIAVQFLLHWVALNICHIFAFSSLALGEWLQ